MQGRVALAGFLWSLLAAAPAGAQLRAQLDLAGLECVDAESLGRQVDALLGRPGFAPPPDLRLELRIAEAAGRLRARIVVRDLTGELRGARTLVAPPARCTSLIRELALVVALLLESEREQVVLTVPETDARPAGREAAPAPMRATLSGGLLGVATLDLLPGVAAGVRAALALDLRTAPRLVAVLEAHGREAGGDGPRLDGLLALAGALVCPALRAAQGARLELCAGATAGALVAQPRGLAGSSTISRAYVDLRVELGLSWAVAGSTALRAEAGVMVPFTRHEFVYGTAGGLAALHEPGPVVPRLAVGVAFGGP